MTYTPIVSLYVSCFFIGLFFFFLTVITLYLPICYIYWAVRWLIRSYFIQKKTLRFIIWDKYILYILKSFCLFELLYRVITSNWFILKYSDLYFYYIGEFFNRYIFTFSLTWYKFIILIFCYVRLNLRVNKYVDTGPQFGGPLEEYFKTQVWKTHQTKEEFQADMRKKAEEAAKEEAAEYNFTSDKSSDKSSDKI